MIQFRFHWVVKVLDNNTEDTNALPLIPVMIKPAYKGLSDTVRLYHNSAGITEKFNGLYAFPLSCLHCTNLLDCGNKEALTHFRLWQACWDFYSACAATYTTEPDSWEVF